MFAQFAIQTKNLRRNGETMNPFTLCLDFWIGSLAAMAPRPGSRTGFPEPFETFFDELNNDIRRAQDEIARQVNQITR